MADDVCPCCGDKGKQHLFDVGAYRYVSCPTCAAARLEPLPVVDPVQLYDETYFVGASNGGYLDYDADAALHSRNARARLDRVLAHMPTAPSVVDLLDVGCASGYVLDEAQARGWAAAGVDVSGFAQQRASARGHLVYATIGDALLAQPPNIATFFQVLEHMTDPEVALAEVADALAAGGVIVIETWDRTSRIARLFGRRWQQANPSSVIHLFSRVGVRRLVERAGFEVINVDTTSKLVSAGLVAGIAAQRWGTVGRAMRTFAEATRLTKVAVPYRFGDLITVIAVKRVVSPGK